MLRRYIKNYLGELIKANRSKKTISTYEFALEYFINWCKKEKLWFKNVSGEDCKRYTPYLSGLGLKPTTINLCITVLKGFYDYLTDTGQVQGNPVNIKKIKVKNEKPENTSINKEIEIILTHIYFLPADLKLTFLLMLYAGLKINEIFKLSPTDIVIIKNHVFMRVISLDGKERLAPVIDEITAKELLNLVIKRVNEKRMFNIKKSHITREVHLIKEKTGIICTPQRLRSLYLNHLINIGCQPDLVRQALGYKGFYIDKNLREVLVESYFPLAAEL